MLSSRLASRSRSQSTLVYPGPDGSLIHDGYANEGQSSTDNLMVDLSHAGYQGGGVAIHWLPEEVALDPLPGDDDHARIQAAIDGSSGWSKISDTEIPITDTLAPDGTAVTITVEADTPEPGLSMVTATGTSLDRLFLRIEVNGRLTCAPLFLLNPRTERGAKGRLEPTHEDFEGWV